MGDRWVDGVGWQVERYSSSLIFLNWTNAGEQLSGVIPGITVTLLEIPVRHRISRDPHQCKSWNGQHCQLMLNPRQDQDQDSFGLHSPGILCWLAAQAGANHFVNVRIMGCDLNVRQRHFLGNSFIDMIHMLYKSPVKIPSNVFRIFTVMPPHHSQFWNIFTTPKRKPVSFSCDPFSHPLLFWALGN